MDLFIKYDLKESAISANCFMSCISIIASLFLIVLFLFQDNLRSLNYFFLFIMAISELLGNISYIIIHLLLHENTTSMWVVVLNTIIIHSDISISLFLFLVGYTINLLIVKGERNLDQKKLFYIFIGLTVSIVYTILFTIIDYNVMKKNDDSSYIIRYGYYADDKFSFGSRVFELIHYIILLALTVIGDWFFMGTMSHLSAKSLEDKQNGWKLMKTRNLMLNYPLVGTLWIAFDLFSLVLNNLISSSNEVSNTQLRTIYIFITFANMFTYLRGLFICLIFITSKKVKKILDTAIEKLSLCMQKLNMFHNQNTF